MDLITSLTSQVLNKAMDGLSLRHKAIAGNLANVDTPDYKRRDVSFEDSLEKAIEETRGRSGSASLLKPASNDEELAMTATLPGHYGNGPGLGLGVNDVQPQITETDSHVRNDGSGVDVESEMVQLAKNTQRYVALTNIQGRFGRTLKSVINSGG